MAFKLIDSNIFVKDKTVTIPLYMAYLLKILICTVDIKLPLFTLVFAWTPAYISHFDCILLPCSWTYLPFHNDFQASTGGTMPGSSSPEFPLLWIRHASSWSLLLGNEDDWPDSEDCPCPAVLWSPCFCGFPVSAYDSGQDIHGNVPHHVSDGNLPLCALPVSSMCFHCSALMCIHIETPWIPNHPWQPLRRYGCGIFLLVSFRPFSPPCFWRQKRRSHPTESCLQASLYLEFLWGQERSSQASISQCFSHFCCLLPWFWWNDVRRDVAGIPSIRR